MASPAASGGWLDRPHVLTAAVSLVTVLVTGVSLIVWRTYYLNHPLWVEHAAYGMWANIHFEGLLSMQGYWGAFRTSLQDGTRHILQPALLGLVWPRLLWWPHSHLLVTALTMYLFLDLLARFVRLRSGHGLAALAATLLFCAARGLYDERNGFGAPWPDYQSMFLLSAAILSLALYAATAKARWLIISGVSVTLATLARDTGAVYAAVMCSPALALVALAEIRRRTFLRGLLHVALAWGIPALPAVVIVVRKIAFFRQYYMTSNVSQLRKPLAVAAASIWQQFSAFAGLALIVCLAVLVVAALVRSSTRQWAVADAIVVAWPLSFLLFLFYNGYTSDVTKEVMYLAPGLVGLAMTLRGGMDLQFRATRLLLIAALVVCGIGAGTGAVSAYDRARHPDADARALRVSQHELAAALEAIPQRVNWHSFSAYDWGIPVSALTFYEAGRFQPTDNAWFHNRKNYWDAGFPNMDLPHLQAFIANTADARVDVAVVLKRPEEKPKGMEDYSFSIAAFVARRVEGDPAWSHYRDVDTAVSGPLALYINTRRMSPGSELTIPGQIH